MRVVQAIFVAVPTREAANSACFEETVPGALITSRVEVLSRAVVGTACLDLEWSDRAMALANTFVQEVHVNADEAGLEFFFGAIGVAFSCQG